MTREARLIALEGMDGGGKSTLAAGLRRELGGPGQVVVTKPAAYVVEAFRAVAESDCGVLYQDVIPPTFRRLAQLVEVTVHLRYRSEQYAAARYVVFDRWLETAAVYCGDYGRHRDWLERVEAGLPRPCPTFFVRVPVELAYERLVARGDRWTTIYSPAALLDKLRRLADRYEQVMAEVEHVPLDGTRPAADVLAEAVRQVRCASSSRPATSPRQATSATSSV